MNDDDARSKIRDSPKTPGGISKSHLTSIRRLGLSRNWKRSGISPFISPLASNSNTKIIDYAGEEAKSRKRKLRLNDENTELSSGERHGKNEISEIAITPPASKEILHTNDSTPIRKVSITRKKSRTIPFKNEETTVNASQEDLKTVKGQDLDGPNGSSVSKVIDTSNDISRKQTDKMRKDIQVEHVLAAGESKLIEISDTDCNKTACKPELPNKLVKECIVVIQNKILKKTKRNKTSSFDNEATKLEVFCDSDTDDIPLSHINGIKVTQHNDHSDRDYKKTESKNSPKVQPIKKNNSTSSKNSVSKKEKYLKENEVSTKLSQSSNSFSDEDDDFEINKKTIFFPKSYEKLSKPSKAKSTGSITQKDIDEIKARIEMKKQLLFAKAQSKDTEELRDLIKKWRKGCQDALKELLELMKKKLPDHSNMNYANILQMLKIPPSYVGYDPDNDCFTTPDDNSILASLFSDL